MPPDPVREDSVPEREVVAVRAAVRGTNAHPHIASMKLRDGRVETADEVLDAIRAHDAHYVMTPVPGMTGYDEHAKTGKRLLLQAQLCPFCGQEVLWA